MYIQEKKKLELEEMNRVLAELGIAPSSAENAKADDSKGAFLMDLPCPPSAVSAPATYIQSQKGHCSIVRYVE